MYLEIKNMKNKKQNKINFGKNGRRNNLDYSEPYSKNSSKNIFPISAMLLITLMVLSIFTIINSEEVMTSLAIQGKLKLVVIITQTISAPLDIDIKLNNDNTTVNITWESISGADSYIAHYSSNLTDLRIMGSSVINVTGIAANYWLDINANATKERYYTISSVKGTKINTSTKQVGKFDIELKQGLNALSIAFNSTEKNLSQVLRPKDSGIIKTVYLYNTSYSKIDYVNGFTKEIQLNQADAIFISSIKDSNLTLVGKVQNITINLSQGLNFVGIPSDNKIPITQTLSTNPTGCIKTIYIFNSENNYTKLDVINNNIFDFYNSNIQYLEKGKSYGIYANKSCLFQ